jgi:rubrerythrin
LGEEKKNYTLMEQTRRENVTEMILEPITGLHQEDYEIDVKVLDKMKDVDLLKIALILEESEKKFFHDASSRVSLPEVARIFQKIAQRKEKNLIKLKALGLNQLL